MSNPLFDSMKKSIYDGDSDAAVMLAKKSLEENIDPLEAVNSGFLPGMSQVGEDFGNCLLFLPDVILAAEAMRKATAVLEPEMRKRGGVRQTAGLVVIGTVKGDVHEIGKSLVATLLTANGFEVIDLGVDVPTETFIDKVGKEHPHILALSALLTTTMTNQRKVIEALETAGLRKQVKVMVGGAPVTRSWAQEIGADGYSEDALGAVREAQHLLGKE